MTTKLKIIVLVLLVATFLIPFFSAQNFSPASDEITHLPSGYSYWKTGFINLNPQHPPFVKLIASFPLLFMDIKFDPKDPNLFGPLKDEWKFGANFLFSNDVDRLFFWGRMPVMLLSLLLGFYIFKWAAEMFSPKAGPDSIHLRWNYGACPERSREGSSRTKQDAEHVRGFVRDSQRASASYGAGILALFIYAFMPNMIAHAQLVTTDLAVAAFSFITLYYLWKFFRANNKRYFVYSGLFLGLALGSKFSAVLLLPIIILLIAALLWPRDESFDSKLDKFVKLALALLALSSIVVYFIYLMPTDLSFYLRGLKSVYADWGNTYSFYLNGEFSPSGWWYYFLFAFLIKTPIPALIVFGLAVIMYKKYKLSINDRLFIFIPLVVFFVITSMRAGNIGIRYLLPVYPFLILYAGGLAEVFKIKWGDLRAKLFFLLIIAMGSWYILSALIIYPDYLAYFNEFVGGPKNGYKYLDDSNIEWGQDLKRLAVYQKQYPDMKVLYSWGNSNPGYYGINNVLPLVKESSLNPSGRYAVNTHFLVRLKKLSQSLNEKGLDWLSLYQPVDRIGYSFFIYEF